MKYSSVTLILFFLSLIITGCTGSVDPAGILDVQPVIFPDYRDVTVPENIAPLNFAYSGTDNCILLVDGITFRPRKGGRFSFRKGTWKEWMKKDSVEMIIAVKKDGSWMSFKPFTIKVSHDRIDPWFFYRLIPPGYQGWQEMGIYQRNLENYSQKAILTNDLTGGNCLNCHTFLNGNPSKMVFHARAAF